MKPIIAPSVLSADFSKLAFECEQIINNGADWIHLDIMDNHFVPNLTFGPPVVKFLRKNVKQAFLDCHLMVCDPASLLDGLAKSEVNQITVHLESFSTNKNCGTEYVGPDYKYDEFLQFLKQIRGLGIRVGVAVSPDTPIVELKPVLDVFEPDMILIMTVVPGFGGQKFIEECMTKVKYIRDHYPMTIDIQVDGGLDENTTSVAGKAGANVIVAGSAIFGKADTKGAIDVLKNELNNNLH